MTATRDRARAVARALSPSHRRWRRLLAGLTLDPDRLERPVAQPGPHDVIICGSPRSGTALLTAMLWQPPRLVAAMEPWDGLRLPPAQLFASLRAEVEDQHRVSRTRLDVPTLDRTGRVAWCRDGERPVPVRVDPEWTLVVKWPSFWRYLELLPDTRFLVCLRDPYDTVASYATTGGRLASGLEYDVAFHHALNAELESATDDPAERRALLYEHVNRTVLPFLDRANVLPVRYERWFSDPDAQLGEVADFVGVGLAQAKSLIGPAPKHAALDDHDRDAVRRLCPSAAALDYSLDR